MTQDTHKPALLARVRRLVVKIGSGVLAHADGLHRERIAALVDEIAAVHRADATWSS